MPQSRVAILQCPGFFGRQRRRRAPKQDTAPEQGSENEISKLIARWNYLEADRKYQATIAATKWESDNCLNHLRDKEKGEIKSKLVNLVPQNFREVFELFDFATAGKRLKQKSRC